MLILRKERLLFIFSIVMLSVCIYVFKADNNKFTSEVTSGETIETVALPVTNKVIVIDAGHGSPDNGAEGANGVTENKINLNISLKLQNLLEQSGATVILTRSDENGIYDLDSQSIKEKKVSDMKNRTKIANTSDADLFISIHLNKIPQSEYWGWQSFFNKKNEESKKIATCIQESLNNTINKENKRQPLVIENIYLAKNVEIPFALIECGFLSNPEEESLLSQNDYQDRLAWGIYCGIMDYFYN